MASEKPNQYAAEVDLNGDCRDSGLQVNKEQMETNQIKDAKCEVSMCSSSTTGKTDGNTDGDKSVNKDTPADDEKPAKPQPNLPVSAVLPRKSDSFYRMEAAWPGEFNKRFSVPYAEYAGYSLLGKINLSEYALVEKEDTIRKGHHAVCPLIRRRSTGILYRCKIVSCSRVHFNLTTLGFNANEFEREIRNCLIERQLLFAFEHPFVRSGLGFFTDQYCNFGVFLKEFPHGTLLDYYEKNEENRIVCKFEEASVCLFAAQVVLALEYLHCIGCVHRDVQSANLLVDGRGYLKLTDFAITVPLPESGRPLSEVTCFRYYAAPEFFNGKGYGMPVDFYALGLVLYELLNGECFSDQEDVFDGEGQVDWGILPEGLAVEEHRRKLTQRLLDSQAIQGQAQSSSAAKSAAAAASLPAKRSTPSADARAFVDDCLLCEPECRPDRGTARFYAWFNKVNFDGLFAQTVELPWRPPAFSSVSYQPDVDEEYPLGGVLDQKPVPPELEPYRHLF